MWINSSVGFCSNCQGASFIFQINCHVFIFLIGAPPRRRGTTLKAFSSCSAVILVPFCHTAASRAARHQWNHHRNHPHMSDLWRCRGGSSAPDGQTTSGRTAADSGHRAVDTPVLLEAAGPISPQSQLGPRPTGLLNTFTGCFSKM